MFGGSDLPPLAQDELDKDERLVWSGRPDPKRTLRQTLPIWFFGIPWTAFAVFWTWGAATGLGHGMPTSAGLFGLLFPLFGLPFILIGVAILSSPYWAYLKAGKTVYAITDKRILIIEGGKSRSVQSYTAGDIGTISRTERPDRSGDLTFAQKVTLDSNNNSRRTDVKFVGIPEVQRVEGILRDTFKQS